MQTKKGRHKPTPKCQQCEDNGFILFKQKHEDRLIDYVAYCDKCKKGEDYRYCGRSINDHKSEYYTKPFSAYTMSEDHAPKNKEEENIRDETKDANTKNTNADGSNFKQNSF